MTSALRGCFLFLLSALVLSGAVSRSWADPANEQRSSGPEPVAGNPADVPRRVSFGMTISAISGPPGSSAPVAINGIAILSVSPSSVAENAGIKANDIITALDGKAISSPADFAKQIRTIRQGTSVKVSILRDGKAEEVIARF